MANTIQIKRSAVSGKVPTTAQLALGELAVNTYDGKLYTKKDDGTASVVHIGGTLSEASDYNTLLRADVDDTIAGNINNTSTGYMRVSVGTTAQRPGSPTQGMIRFNTSLGCFEGYTGSNWVNLSPATIDDIGTV